MLPTLSHDPKQVNREPSIAAGDRLAYLPSIYGALLLFLLTVGGIYLVIRLQFLIILLFLSVVVACGIAGPVRRLERRGISRALAIVIVYALIGVVVAGIGWYAVPRLVGQAGQVAQDIPRQIESTRQLRERLQAMGDDYPILNQFDARLVAAADGLGAKLTGQLLALPKAVAKAVFAVTTIFTLAFLLLITWARLKSTLLSLIHPRHRVQTEAVLGEMGNRLGAYLRAKAIVMVIVGALIYVSLALLRSPYAVLVAIFAGAMEALPKIGPWIGRAAIVLSVIPLGWEKVAIAVAAHVVIENAKGYGLSPLIEGNQVDIHPLTAFIAVIAGGILLGWVGAFVAVPAAAVLQVVVEDVVIPWRRRQLAAAERGTPSADGKPDELIESSSGFVSHRAEPSHGTVLR